MKYISNILTKDQFSRLQDLVYKALVNPNNPKLGRVDEYSASSTFFRPKYNKELVENWYMPEQYKKLNIVDYILGLSPEENYDRCFEELEEFNQRDLMPLLKYMVYFVSLMKENKIVMGVGRGSSVASYVLYLIGVHKVDSIKYNLDYKEFFR